MSLNEYWGLTPKQFKKHLDNYIRKHQERMEEIDYLNHILGKYMSIGFNKPKAYPKKHVLSKANKKGKMTPEEMQEVMKQNISMLNGKIQ